jgi:peptidoglycan hydrolase-like protein with peptidoglycan-binding domain
MAVLGRKNAAILLLLAVGAVAQTPKPAPKPPAAAVKKPSTPVKKTVPAKKKAPAKKTAAKKRVVRPRVQQQPTKERYSEIQHALIGRGLLQGPATGVWGPESITALKSFQQSQKLDATGKIDALSLIRLGLGPRTDVGLPPSDPAVKP